MKEPVERDSETDRTDADGAPERTEPEPSSSWDYTMVLFLVGIIAIAIAAGFALDAIQ